MNQQEIAKREFDDSVKQYIGYSKDFERLSRRFFDFQIAFTGLLGIISSIIFSNPSSELFKPLWFKMSFIIITALVFIIMISTIWRSAAKTVENFKKSERRTILLNIRHDAISGGFGLGRYMGEAEKLLAKENLILQDMKNNDPIETIIRKYSSPDTNRWKGELILWGILFLSVPTLFLIRLIY